MQRAAITVLAATLLVGGCGADQNAVLSDRGLTHTRFGYRIATTGSPRTFVSPEWRIENSLPDAARNTGVDADAQWTVDVYDDGEEDVIERAPFFDLRLEHRRTHGSIWVRTFPISDVNDRKGLPVLTQNYVANAAFAGYATAGIGDGAVLGFQPRRFATRVLDTEAIGLDGQEAVAVLFDVVGINPQGMSADGAVSRALVVLVRVPFRHRAHTALGEREWPVLMVVGSASPVADFDSSLGDFQRFLGAIDMAPTR